MNNRGPADGHTPSNTANHAGATADHNALGPQTPTITLPKGGGVIRGIDEKFGVNPVTGTGALSVPIAVSPGCSDFGPQLTLSYDSGAGNDLFGLGWSLALPSISRKTDKGLPQYDDAHDSDVFLLSGVEDLVPTLTQQSTIWLPEIVEPRTIGGKTYAIRRYRPRVEGLFARIERWTNVADAKDCFWRSISHDNVPKAPSGGARCPALGRFAPLILDGLDEVPALQRAACVEAINHFHEHYGFNALIVCCCTAEYNDILSRHHVRLESNDVLVLNPLTNKQIDAYLVDSEVDLGTLRADLTRDSELRELAQTPLMLRVMTQMYQGEIAEQLRAQSSLEQRRQLLMAAYVEPMLSLPNSDTHFSSEDTRRWLARLAVAVRDHALSIFHLDQQTTLVVCQGLAPHLAGAGRRFDLRSAL